MTLDELLATLTHLRQYYEGDRPIRIDGYPLRRISIVEGSVTGNEPSIDLDYS